jgi:outer membrane protein
MPRTLFVIALLALAATLVRAGTGDPVSRPGVLRLTLQTAIHMALEKNFTIQVQEFGPQIARERITGELGSFDPLLELEASRSENTRRDVFLASDADAGVARPRDGFHLPDDTVTRVDRLSASLSGRTPLGTTYDVGFGADNSTGSARRFDDVYSSGLDFGIRQPLLRGFGAEVNLAQVRIARTNAEISEWELRDTLINVITEVAYAYNDLHTANQNLLVAERSRELARQLMQNNQQRAEIGVMTPLDVTTARAQVASREEAVILARRNVLDNENLLKQLLTRELERMLSIRVEIEPPPALRIRADVMGGIRDALEMRPDYRQAMLDIQRRHILVAVAKNDLLPKLDLVTSLRLLGVDNDIGTSASRTLRRDQTEWSAGAVFSLPIGNRAARSGLNSERLQAAQALVSLQRLEQQIVVDVDNAAGQIVTNRERIESTSEARKLAAESLAAGEERLRAGTGTTFEVLELQEELSSAEFAELRARGDYNKAVAEFRRKTGTTLRAHGVLLN